MTTVRDLIEELEKVAIVAPEYEPNEAPELTLEPLNELLQTYPGLTNYSMYVEWLRHTGGAHIHNTDFSLGVYGFGGNVVAALEEGPLLDAGRYFQFGEVLYHFDRESEFTLAFDLESEVDQVYMSPMATSAYSLVRPSFLELLKRFGAGQYPR